MKKQGVCAALHLVSVSVHILLILYCHSKLLFAICKHEIKALYHETMQPHAATDIIH